MPPAGEVIIVPLHHKGHTFPATELSRHLASRGLRITLFLPSPPSSPLDDNIAVVEFSGTPPPPPPPPALSAGPPAFPHPLRPPPPPPPSSLHEDTSNSLENYLSRWCEDARNGGSDTPKLLCAVVDVMMSHCFETCVSHGVPVVGFFTSSGCAAALEHAASKFSMQDLGHSGTIEVPGLPADMPLTEFELRPEPPPGFAPPRPPPGALHLGHGYPQPPPPPPPAGGGYQEGHPPPQAAFAPHGNNHPDAPSRTGQRHHPGGAGKGGGPPRGLGDTGAAAALLFNTCDDLERPFLDFVAKETGKPVWGVGPLLPADFWPSAGAPVRDEVARPHRGEATISEGEVRAWLDLKPPASVIYVSFGTLNGPPAEDLAELAAALEDLDRPFIWALQADPANNGGGYFPDGLASRARESGRGLVIRGWAPQLTILSHPSTAVFLSHCGWNSTVEALAMGKPMVAWPVKGDQFCNARLVTERLGVGRPVRSGAAGPRGRVEKADVAEGIERVMADEGVRARAAAVRSIFASGFPGSSAAATDAFVDFIHYVHHKKDENRDTSAGR